MIFAPFSILDNTANEVHHGYFLKARSPCYVILMQFQRLPYIPVSQAYANFFCIGYFTWLLLRTPFVQLFTERPVVTWALQKVLEVVDCAFRSCGWRFGFNCQSVRLNPATVTRKAFPGLCQRPEHTPPRLFSGLQKAQTALLFSQSCQLHKISCDRTTEEKIHDDRFLYWHQHTHGI